MHSDKRLALAAEILQTLARSDVAYTADPFRIRHVDDTAVIEVDLGEPDAIYRITVGLHARHR